MQKKILSVLLPFYAEIRSGNISGLLTRYSDLLVALGVIGLIAIIIVQIPPSLISLLVIVNLAISVLMLMVSLYISSPVQLSSYPTILLLTTLFRLTISISITRAILTTGEPGTVVHRLGEITAGGNLIAGVVMFLIILVVQFIVVAKGAERVSEVAARFTLDAMPGKQMSIDADMRSGLISQDHARRMRSELSKESQLHGAMDGAMKFVKGDSIATIIIVLINIVAGLATGVALKGMTFPEAASKYTILTIGDGLSAIISSLLITLSAGIVVTRVATDEENSNIGSDITAQLTGNPKPLFITAGLLVALSILLTSIPAFIVALCVGGFSYSLVAMKKRAAEEAIRNTGVDPRAPVESDELVPTFAVPLAIVVSPQLSPLVDPMTESGAAFRAELPRLRSAIYYDLGIMLPNCFVSGDAPLKENQYFIAIKEVPVVHGSIKPNCVFVNDSAENIRIFGLEGDEVLNPADLRPGAWLPMEQRAKAEAAGLKVWEPAEVITLHLSRVMKRYAHEFLGIQEAQAYLDFAARGVPKLVEEVVPKTISIHQFTDVLQRLVQEGISIRDIKSILDALSEWGRIEKDAVTLTEYVRASLKRYISFRYTGGQDTLFVYLLDPEIEDVIRGAIRRTSTGAFLSLDPSIAHDILTALRREIAGLPPTAQNPVIITDMELRRFVRKMVELEFPTLAVLSYQELAPELNVQPVGRISMRPAAAADTQFGNAISREQVATDFPELLNEKTPEPAALAERY